MKNVALFTLALFAGITINAIIRAEADSAFEMEANMVVADQMQYPAILAR